MKRQICEKHAGEVVLHPDIHGTDRCAVCAEIAAARREERELHTKLRAAARAVCEIAQGPRIESYAVYRLYAALRALENET